MHELSVVMSIIDIAEAYAGKAGSDRVDEIELDIGTLSGVDMDALDFAWTEAVKTTLLSRAVRRINRIAARARCMDCDHVFDVDQPGTPCPVCSGYLVVLIRGKELRVKSLLVGH